MLNHLYRKSLVWFMPPPCNLGSMPLFTIGDLPLMLAFPQTFRQNIIYLRAYRVNLSATEWADLSGVYGRNMLWFYMYILFLWARCCDRLDAVMRHPDKTLIAEIFIRYICEIDSYVDSFDSRHLWEQHPRRMKHFLRVKHAVTDLHRQLQRLAIPCETKLAVLRLIAAYRRDSLRAMRHWAHNTAETLPDTIQYKEVTSASLFGTWSGILNTLYNVPKETAAAVRELFFNMGMVLQIIDDVADIPADYAVHAQNIGLAVIRENPLDWNRLQHYLQAKPDEKALMRWIWIQHNLVDSYPRICAVYHHYSQRLLCTPSNPAQELLDHLNRFRQLVR